MQNIPSFAVKKWTRPTLIFILLFSLFSVFTSTVAQEDSLRYYLNKVQLNSAANMREMVYVHKDKEVYQPGDTIYVAAYITERLSHKLASQANTLWGIVTDAKGDLFLKERFLIVNGKAKGQFVIPDRTDNGIYQLNAFTNWQKNIGSEGVFVDRFEVRSLKTPEIRWGVEELKKAYTPGDTVDIVVSLKNASYEPLAGQKFEAVFGTEKYKLQANDQGEANLKFTLSDADTTIKSIDFTGYLSPYKRADYKDEVFSIDVNIQPPKAEIQFLPESGYMVEGIPSKVGFRAVDYNGNPIEINGIINDSKGNMVSVVQTMHDGMGYLNMVPKADETYTFKQFSEHYTFEKSTLPKVLPTGLTLKYVKTQDSTVFMKVLHNFPNAVQGAININHTGFSYMLAKGTFTSGAVIEVPIAKLPAGIMRVTFFGPDETPMAERLVFVNKQKILHIDGDLDYTLLRTRRPSVLDIQVRDFQGHPVKTHLSISVVDSAYSTGIFTHASSIEASYLLNSELKGNIHNPDFYFQNSKADPYLDLLMITHGWRRFTWYDSIRNYKEVTKSMINHDRVEGQITRKGEPVTDGKVTFIALSSMPPESVNVDKNGKFWFQPEYASYFSPDLLLKATSEQYKDRIDLELQPNDSLKNTAMTRIGFHGLQAEDTYMQKVFAEQVKEPESTFMLGDVKLLNMVNVEGVKQDEFKNSPKDFFAASRSYYKTYKDLDYMTDFASIVQQAAPSILIDYATGRATFNYNSGGYNPSAATSDPYSGPGLLVVVDDIARGKVLSEYDYLTLDDILDITVIRGNEAFYMYGEQANEGAIIVRTRIDTTPKATQSIFDKRNMAVLPPYCDDREFYTPKYDTEEKLRDPMPNLRTTVYWKNNLETDEQGRLKIEWYNNDLVGTKLIHIQAYGENGQPGSFHQTYRLR